MQRTIGINVKITFAEPNSLPRSEGKLNRVVDNRKK
jgi:phenylacetate-coenzyme A ligase PaaK-like adenylate-forming protein